MRRALTAAGILGMLLVVACCGGFASLSWQRLNAMGEGSARRAETWRKRLQGVADPDVARAIGPKVVSKRFADREWVFGVCEDSHADPQGGTIVVKDSHGRLRAFFGHVCGPYFLDDLLQHMDSLDATYRKLSEWQFGEYLFPPEG